MGPASGGQPANTRLSAKSKSVLGTAHNLLSSGAQEENRKGQGPGFSADSRRGGVSSQAGEVSSMSNSSFSGCTGIRLSPRARGLNPSDPEAQTMGKEKRVRRKPGHRIPLGRGRSLHG